MELGTFIEQFAAAMKAADDLRPQAVSKRSGRVYQAGIGPHGEDEAVDLTVFELTRLFPVHCGSIKTRVVYPNSRKKCDLMLGTEWAIEVKMARLSGDNGKPDDTAFKDILSPYESDRSALTDCGKLVGSGLRCRFGMLIYGFEGKRPLAKIIDEFEVIARTRVGMSRREVQEFGPLVHPVFASGRVFGWELFLKQLS